MISKDQINEAIFSADALPAAENRFFLKTIFLSFLTMSEAMDASNTLVPSAHGSRGKGNFPVRRPRGSRGRGSGRGKPDNRSTTWRVNQNTKFIAEMDAARDARFARFALPPETTTDLQSQQPQVAKPYATPEYSTVQFLGMATTSNGHPLPIATQAIGFLVNQYYLKLQEQLGADRVTERCTVHQLYRHSLAQLSYHLYRIRMDQVPRYSYRDEYPDPPIIPADMLESFKTLELNIGWITSYIQRIGCIVANDTPTVPMLMMDESPLYINIFNLRRTLDAIARNEDRFDDFMSRNSIPGLAVVQDRITNVEKVMPRAYGRDIMYRDASAVRALMKFSAAKMRDVTIFTGRLGQIGEGSPAILLKSTATLTDDEVRIPPTPTGTLSPIIGSVDS